ncbi:hypothetical protein KHA80_02930 [Anaerobacillus sp. HL2]|nr:hypothetical protein KHA80_02930 [Anaerobacillus sp. HL2]
MCEIVFYGIFGLITGFNPLELKLKEKDFTIHTSQNSKEVFDDDSHFSSIGWLHLSKPE